MAGRQVQDLADRFGGAVTIAVGVSVVDAGLAESFDVVIPRDGPDGAHPDLAFAARPAAGPVVGVVRANQQPEYQASAHDRVHMVIDEVLDSRSARLRPIDTRVDPRIVGQRSAAEVESQFAGLDAVVTTRLHGLVLGLRCGVPVVAVDPIPGGAKVAAQARAVGWPAVMDAESSTRAAWPTCWPTACHPRRGSGQPPSWPTPAEPWRPPTSSSGRPSFAKIAVPRGTPIAHAGPCWSAGHAPGVGQARCLSTSKRASTVTSQARLLALGAESLRVAPEGGIGAQVDRARRWGSVALMGPGIGVVPHGCRALPVAPGLVAVDLSWFGSRDGTTITRWWSSHR